MSRKKQSPSPLRSIRRTRTINQQQLAKLVGVSQKTISLAERGELPRKDIQARIAAILGVSPADIFPDQVAS